MYTITRETDINIVKIITLISFPHDNFVQPNPKPLLADHMITKQLLWDSLFLCKVTVDC